MLILFSAENRFLKKPSKPGKNLSYFPNLTILTNLTSQGGLRPRIYTMRGWTGEMPISAGSAGFPACAGAAVCA